MFLVQTLKLGGVKYIPKHLKSLGYNSSDSPQGVEILFEKGIILSINT